MTKEEANKLIAKFMGVFVEERVLPLRYYESWDWLMPVVEKIEAWHCVEIRWASCCIIMDDGFDEEKLSIEAHENSKIKSTWLAVVEFIKWYNQNKS